MNNTEHIPKAKKIILGLTILLFINVILPIILYSIFIFYMDTIYAILLSGIPPMIETIYHISIDGHLDIVNLISILSIGLSLLVTILTKDPYLAMVKDSFFTFLFGIAYIISIYYSNENLIWYYNRRMSDRNTKEYFDRIYSNPRVRYYTNIMCYVWGIGLIFESILRVILIYHLSIDTMVITSPILVWSTILGLSIWNLFYIRSIRKKHGQLNHIDILPVVVVDTNKTKEDLSTHSLDTSYHSYSQPDDIYQSILQPDDGNQAVLQPDDIFEKKLSTLN